MPLLNLMCVIAHPDDESLGMGPALAKYAAEGVRVTVVCATRGERGWAGPQETNPGLQQLGNIREAELLCAAKELGVAQVYFLDWIDGELADANPVEVIQQLAALIRSERPQVILTFDPFGAYGHPDHIAICQQTTAAVVAAADTHRVSKLYYLADTVELAQRVEALDGASSMQVNGEMRYAVAWADWAITAQVSAPEHWRTVWRAIQCHTSQKHEFVMLIGAADAAIQSLFDTRTFYRAISLVLAPHRETDLFAGVR